MCLGEKEKSGKGEKEKRREREKCIFITLQFRYIVFRRKGEKETFYNKMYLGEKEKKRKRESFICP